MGLFVEMKSPAAPPRHGWRDLVFIFGYWMVLPLEGRLRTELRMNALRLPSHLSRNSPPTRVNLCARPLDISRANSFTCFLLMSLTLTSLIRPPGQQP